METLQPRESSLQPRESSLQPRESSLQPRESSLQPRESSLQPRESSLQPRESSLQPRESTLQPGMSTLRDGTETFRGCSKLSRGHPARAPELMTNVIQGWRRKMRGLSLATFSCPYGGGFKDAPGACSMTNGIRAEWSGAWCQYRERCGVPTRASRVGCRMRPDQEERWKLSGTS
jgi:hypothetical protein